MGSLEGTIILDLLTFYERQSYFFYRDNIEVAFKLDLLFVIIIYRDIQKWTIDPFI